MTTIQLDSKLQEIARKFKFSAPVKQVRPLGEGLINETFLVETEGAADNYIMQCKNKNIFQNIPAMMENIDKVTKHLRQKIAARGGNPQRETMTIIPTIDDKLYYIDQEEYWTACLYIEDTITHQYANSPELAYQGGKGIGEFQYLLADMREPLSDILPGFHNMRIRFQQWDEAVSKNAAGRLGELKEEVAWIEKYRNEMLEFWSKVEDGTIPTRVTHNDTKISNILFDENNEVLCVIDLDTVLNSTCLNDYGDAIRSYTNAGLEDDQNLNQVYVKMDVFESYTKGYLSEAAKFLVPSELSNLVFSAKYITYEQTLRFLMDYINGDTYYRINYEKHNLVRTHAQYKLLCSIEENYAAMCEIVNKLV